MWNFNKKLNYLLILLATIKTFGDLDMESKKNVLNKLNTDYLNDINSKPSVFL